LDNYEPEDRLIDQFPSGAGGLPPLLHFLRPDVRHVAVAYRQHTGVIVERIEIRITDAEGTIKELNFPSPEAP
jgi:hypothetical protein